MPLRKSACWAVPLLLATGCKSSPRAEASASFAEEALSPSARLGIEVRLTLDFDGRPEFVGYREISRIFDTNCVSCHGTGNQLDLSSFPFRSRFASQEELMQEVINRLRGTEKPMPPAPKTRLGDQEIALVERWASTLQSRDSLRVPDPSVFAGAAIKVQWHEDGGTRAGEWNQDWNGRAALNGNLVDVPPDGALNLKLFVLGEDSLPVLEKTFFRVHRGTGPIILEALVREADLRRHSLNRDAPKPGTSGVIHAAYVGSDAITVSWEKASDLATTSEQLLYSLYVSESDSVGNLASIQSFGIPASSGLNLLSATMRSLKPGVRYHFNVVVTDEHGQQAIYKPLLQATLSDTVAPLITSESLSIASLTSSSARVKWQGAQDDLDRPDELSYSVFISKENNIADVGSMLRNGTQMGPRLSRKYESVLNDLEGGKTYFVNVLVMDRRGNASAYRMSQITMPAAGAGRRASTIYSPYPDRIR